MRTDPPEVPASQFVPPDADESIEKWQAKDETKSEFDYIVVGSGAGGGPLAARLAIAGKRVLVIEAGGDPAKVKPPRTAPPAPPGREQIDGEATLVPGYYAAASEDPQISWQFSVRHHQDLAAQKGDKKYNRGSLDNGGPLDKKYHDREGGERRQGVFYPRSTGIGGCTAHHAMITIAPNDKDWSYIADLTGDESWRPGPMRGYFARIERCQYIDSYNSFLGRLLGPVYRIYRRLILLLDPRAVLDNGGHGLKGWVPTNLIDPFLVSTIAKEDHPLFKVIVKSALGVLHGDWPGLAWLKSQLVKTRVVPAIDFNDLNTRRAKPEGVFLIPIGTESRGETSQDSGPKVSADGETFPEENDGLDEEGRSAKGRRFGVREHLLKIQRQFPDRLVIKSGAHVTRILFEQGGNPADENKEGDKKEKKEKRDRKDGKAHDEQPVAQKADDAGSPRAIGVECALGDHLYEASPMQEDAPQDRTRYFVKAGGGEVILCGGAFNTPQLLMLSGIGHAEELANSAEAWSSSGASLKGLSRKEAAIAREGGLCALRGSDGRLLTDADGDPWRIHLPGVGCNLQDRYEVTVVSELDRDFKSLETVSFKVGDPNDNARTQWLQDGTGLYSTNGGTLAVIRRSKSALEAGEFEPDLFTFGAPAAFRGYYWNWSRELFKPTLGATEEKKRLWSWVILKAYTSNQGGTVRLISPDPFKTPEVCFDVFNEREMENRASLQRELEEHLELCESRARAGWGLTDELRRQRRELDDRIAASDAILKNSQRDLDALVDAVKFMREVNRRNPHFSEEIQPGREILDDSDDMKDWIRGQTWGHHASCTCRIGSDGWQANPAHLKDKGAVLDSRFRVHGVRGLRIVDASVFPRIPGYFILAPILMMSEKAADTILADAAAAAATYHPGLRVREEEAIASRREIAWGEEREEGVKEGMVVPEHVAAQKVAAGERPAPAGEGKRGARNTVGLAISGGGIRSATFALGVLQTMAENNRLRGVDFMSTVSGGGFIGSFLGRLFMRDSVTQSHDPCGRVQDILKKLDSAPLWWLRTQANYIFATGFSDFRLNLAIFWRNLFTVHLVVAALLFTLFGVLAWLPQGVGVLSDWLGLFRLRALLEPLLAPPVVRGLKLCAWWWLPLLVFALAVVPVKIGYWLAPKVGSYRPYPFHSLLAWLVLFASALFALQIPGGLLIGAGVAALLILAWGWQEVARWGALQGRETVASARQVGSVVRNRLSRSLGELIFIFLVTLAWVVLDTTAAVVAAKGWALGMAAIAAALGPLWAPLRKMAMELKQAISFDGKKKFSLQAAANMLGLPLALFLLWVVDVQAHALLQHFPGWGWGIAVVAMAGAFSLTLGRAFDFLNLSSLYSTYAARLTRTFLGASNPARVYSPTNDDGRDIQFSHPEDDIPHHQYHPEKSGGPLHLINVCVNETVDVASGREVRERKGLPMCVTPHGATVGRRYFALWSIPDKFPRWQARRRWLNGLDATDPEPYSFRGARLARDWWQRWRRRARGAGDEALPAPPVEREKPARTALRALPVATDPNAFHVFATKESHNAEVEPLSLGAWTAISGAAFSTGVGRETRLPVALFMGLTNVRLGYWWDSGIRAEERPGQYPLPLWRKIKRIPVTLFRMQSMLLAEWKGRFSGASRWFWYLSDGGHFEVTGLYELIRRRVRLMIVSDAGEDPEYRWGDLALLTQQAREDFGAEIKWLDPKPSGPRTWADFDDPPEPWVQDWIQLESLGALGEINRKGNYHAALARVNYPGSSENCWILLIKPGLNEKLTRDILNYGKNNEDFPQQPTFDQVFDDQQWESYRALGQQLAAQVIKRPRP